MKIDRKIVGSKIISTENYLVQWDISQNQVVKSVSVLLKWVYQFLQAVLSWKAGHNQASKGDVDSIMTLKYELSCRIKFCNNVQMFNFYYQYGSCFQTT